MVYSDQHVKRYAIGQFFPGILSPPYQTLFGVLELEHVYGGKTRVFSAIYHFFLPKSNVREVGYKFGGHLFLTLMLNTRI